MRVFWGVIHKVFRQILTLCPLLFSPGMVAWINYDHIKERDLVGKFAQYINFTFQPVNAPRQSREQNRERNRERKGSFVIDNAFDKQTKSLVQA